MGSSFVAAYGGSGGASAVITTQERFQTANFCTSSESLVDVTDFTRTLANRAGGTALIIVAWQGYETDALHKACVLEIDGIDVDEEGVAYRASAAAAFVSAATQVSLHDLDGVVYQGRCRNVGAGSMIILGGDRQASQLGIFEIS